MYMVYHGVAIYLVKPISFLGGCEVHEISSIFAINTTVFSTRDILGYFNVFRHKCLFIFDNCIVYEIVAEPDTKDANGKCTIIVRL